MQKLDLIAILKEAWALNRQSLQPLLGASALCFAIVVAITMVLFQVVASWQGADLTVSEELRQVSEPIQLILVLVLAPFEAGLAYLGWRRATGQPVSIGAVFNAWAMAAPLGLIALITAVLVNLGLVLMVLPGIYLMAVLSQANLYYLFTGGSPLKAMIESAKVVHGQLTTVIPLYAAMIALLMLAILPFGLGLIIAIPLFFHVKGVLFRELFPQFSPNQQVEPEVGGEAGHFEA